MVDRGREGEKEGKRRTREDREEGKRDRKPCGNEEWGAPRLAVILGLVLAGGGGSSGSSSSGLVFFPTSPCRHRPINPLRGSWGCHCLGPIGLSIRPLLLDFKGRGAIGVGIVHTASISPSHPIEGAAVLVTPRCYSRLVLDPLLVLSLAREDLGRFARRGRVRRWLFDYSGGISHSTHFRLFYCSVRRNPCSLKNISGEGPTPE